MLRRVAEDFDLEEDVVLSFRTSTFDACRGREVVIPESAYSYLWKFLDEVDVGIVERAQGLLYPTQSLHSKTHSLTWKRTKSASRRQQKRAQEKRRAISPIAPEYPPSPLTEDFPAASSTVIYEEAPLDEERSHTIILDGAERGVAGSSKVADMTEGKVVAPSQKSKNADDEHSDDQQLDQLEVSQEEAVRLPLEIADLEPITEPEDSGEGKSNSQKKFKAATTSLSKSNKGTCVVSIIVGC
jgi:hypothetical protein